MTERRFCLPRPLSRVRGLSGERVDSILQPIDLRLDDNEGQRPPEDLIDALHGIGPEIIGSYPSTTGLESELAGLAGVEPDRVLVTAGADEGLERVFRAFLDSSRNYVLPEPTFEMLPRYGQLVGAELRSVPWFCEPFPTDEIIARIDADTGAVFVVSPNNPTGLSATVEDINRIAEAAPHVLVVVDLAYAEFAETDPTMDVLRQRNVVVARTLSWFAAMRRLPLSRPDRERSPSRGSEGRVANLSSTQLLEETASPTLWREVSPSSVAAGPGSGHMSRGGWRLRAIWAWYP